MKDRVLIVDDDPFIVKLLEKVMSSNELETVSAGSGQEALDILAAQSFDVILMDVMLGDMEGFDVIKQLRNRGIKTPVMIVSGRNEDYDSLYGLSVGADDYITKPFRPLVLGAKVKALIRCNKDRILDHAPLWNADRFLISIQPCAFLRMEKNLIFPPGNPLFFCCFFRTRDRFLRKI